MTRILAYLFVLMLIVACRPSRPDGILSQGEMEDILYDMHKAQAVYDDVQFRNDTAALIALRANVLAKHDVTQADWDSSYFYYCRNADQLYEIYQSLSERVQGEVLALGGKVNGAEGAEADTANVWRQESSFVLMQQAPYNVVSFNVVPDSTFKDGDRITLQYNTKFIFEDGYRDVVAYMAVYYSNDSIAVQTTHTTSDSQGVLTILNDVDRLHVKKIKGFFMLARNDMQSTSNINSSMLHIASITNVKLLHLHTTPPATDSRVEKADSTKVDSLRRDSLMNDKPAPNRTDLNGKPIAIKKRDEMLKNSVMNKH